MAYVSSTTTSHFAVLGSALARVRTVVSNVMTEMQIARLAGALYEMTDGQLEQVGIQRSNIAEVARRLVTQPSK